MERIQTKIDKCNCGRYKKAEFAFCCHGCTLASERGYEVHESGLLGHTKRCNEDHASKTGQTVELPEAK